MFIHGLHKPAYDSSSTKTDVASVIHSYPQNVYYFQHNSSMQINYVVKLTIGTVWFWSISIGKWLELEELAQILKI